MSHSGVNLAVAFTKILDDFGIAHKVSLLDNLHEKLGLTVDIVCQILGITCDNASPNNAMIDALAGLVVAFPGAVNRMHCFTHILNLVIEVILCQFDVLKAKAGEVLDVALQEVVDLAGNIEAEEAAMDNGDNGEEEEGDREEDPYIGMAKDEQDELDLTVHPVWLVLVKVSLSSKFKQTLIMNCQTESSYKNLPM